MQITAKIPIVTGYQLRN